MTLPQDRRSPCTSRSALIADVAAEVAGAIAYLETMSVQLRAEERAARAAAIPPGLLAALRHSSRRAALDADRALTAMSPTRAAVTRRAAAQIREVEALRFGRRLG